jgi:ABC-type multidrug transport system fused ATPase/permease subunit
MADFFRKFFYILGESKKKLFGVALLFLFVAGLDFLGIGLFIPLMSIILSPDQIQNQFFYQFLVERFQITVRTFSLFLCGGIFIVFFLRNLLYILSSAYIFKFGFFQMTYLRERLLDAYMKLPYIWHLKQNSARVIQNINGETSLFSQTVLLPFLRLFGHLIISLFLLVLILQENLLFTLILIFLIGLIFFIFSHYTKKFSPRLGRTISLSNEKIIKNIKQGLGSIKDVKINAKENFFRENIHNEANKFAIASTKYQIINLSPTSIIELTIVTYILVWFGVYSILNIPVQNLIPLFTIVALSGLRMLPIITQIMQTTNNFHRAEYAMEKLYHDLKSLEEVGGDVASRKIKKFNKIEVKNLNFRYDEEYVLQNINMEINRNDIIGITGETGSGKTTFINVLLGLLENNDGEILVDGTKYKNKYLRHLIAYIPQDIFLLDDSIRKNVAFGIKDRLIDDKKIEKSLKSAQVYNFVKKLPKGIDTFVGENGVRLSGGQKQRIGIARALYHDRKIFVFDEATSSLDYKTEKKVQEAIMSLKDKKTIIMVAHRLRTLKECDKIHVIDNGKIVKKGKYKSIRNYLG